jgi:hypothetical protein
VRPEIWPRAALYLPNRVGARRRSGAISFPRNDNHAAMQELRPGRRTLARGGANLRRARTGLAALLGRAPAFAERRSEMKEKGLNRGGAKGQSSEQEQGSLNQQGNSNRRGEGLGRTGLDQGAQRGGLRREPDLAGREQETGHEVD